MRTAQVVPIPVESNVKIGINPENKVTRNSKDFEKSNRAVD